MSLIGKAAVLAKANSPKILMVGGIALSIGCTVHACMSTPKAIKFHDEFKANKKIIKETYEMTKDDPDFKTSDGDIYTPKDYKLDMFNEYKNFAIKMTLTYLPATLMGIASIVSIVTSNNILQKRNLAMSAAYVTTSELFKKYRERVVSKFGEETDEELRYGIVTETYSDQEINQDGKTVNVTKERKVIYDLNEASEWARWFGKNNPDFRPNDIEWDKAQIRAFNRTLNDSLMASKHSYKTMNECYKVFNFDHVTKGLVGGFIYDGRPESLIDVVIIDAKRQAFPESEFEQRYLQWLESIDAKDTKRNREKFRNDVYLTPELLLDFRYADGRPPETDLMRSLSAEHILREQEGK